MSGCNAEFNESGNYDNHTHSRYYPEKLSPGQRDVLQTLLDAFIRLGDPKALLIDDKRAVTR